MGFKYQGFDFIGVDGSLTEEELLVRREVRSFVEERVKPRIEEWWREGKIDRGLAREMGAMGLLGAVPRFPVRALPPFTLRLCGGMEIMCKGQLLAASPPRPQE
jgi:alkylation response protein AidB-like acyl-CoA dehydrogenase